jgi:hypothetical protein
MTSFLPGEVAFSLPDSCRKSAIECEQEADRISDPETKAVLLASARYWRELAVTIENYAARNRPP